MRRSGWIAVGASALLAGMFGAPVAHAAKPPPAPPKAIQFQLASMSVAESDGNVFVNLTRNVTKGKAAVTVGASIATGDTAEVEDIPSGTSTATFASGSGLAQAVLPLPDDTIHEGDETFTISIVTVSKGYLGNDTISVQINENDPAPPPPHPGTFTVPPGHVASFSNVNINSCNDLRLRAVVGDVATELADNGSGACNEPATPTVSEKIVNNTLSPMTMHIELVDDACGATYGSDHTGAGNGEDSDHAHVLEVEGNSFEVDFLDGGGQECTRVDEDAIPDTNDGDAQIDVAIWASPVDTGIWIVPSGWEVRFDQFAIWGCFNAVEGHLVIDGVDTVTLSAGPAGDDCYSAGLDDWIQKNTSGATWLMQLVLEDVTCAVRYSTSHTSTGGTESVDHTWNHDVNGSDYQVAIAHAGKDCVNEDVDVFPGFDQGVFLPHFDVYQSSF